MLNLNMTHMLPSQTETTERVGGRKHTVLYPLAIDHYDGKSGAIYVTSQVC